VETFGCYECFFAEFIAVGITEDDTGKWCTATGIVDDLFNYSANVTVTFCKVKITQTCRLFIVMGVRFENGMRASLCPDDPTHCSLSLGCLEGLVRLLDPDQMWKVWMVHK